MFDTTEAEVLAVYEQLKDRYDLVLTTFCAQYEGAKLDGPLIIGNAHGQIMELYEDGVMLVLDIMDEQQTKGTHWHPYDVQSAVENIAEFMDGRSDYHLSPFPNSK